VKTTAYRRGNFGLDSCLRFGDNSNAFDKNLIGLVSQKTIRSGSATGTILADVKNYFDEGTTAVLTGIVGWDWPVAPTNKGNLTRVSQWRNLPSEAWLDTKIEYDHAGNPTKRIDAKNQETIVTFAASPCAGGFVNIYAFPTKIKNPAQHEVNITYDCSTGKPLTISDANSNLTTASYAGDALDRLMSITYPDGGSKGYSYQDSSNTITETVGLNSCSVANISRTTVYDGLGRVVSASVDDGGGLITTTTEFDGLGRTVRAHVPKRATDTVDAWTETEYDFLGRPLKVSSGCVSTTTACSAGGTNNQQATTTSFVYSVLSTTTTAPGSKRMQHFKDGFGRLVKVIEDPLVVPNQSPTPLQLETSYTNDLLDRLTAVTQGTLPQRTFSFDSLGRLLSTTQPESGTTSNSYDNNGNVLSRTDARGYMAISVYDSLNRVTRKTYSTTPQPSQVAEPFHVYPDTVKADFLWDTRFKGQLSGTVTTYGGAAVSRTEYLTFDAMGRVTSSMQSTGGTVANFGYTYNKAGMLETMRYPSARVVTNCYNAGGSVKKISGVAAGATTVYADSALYASHGGLASVTVGPSYQMTMGYNTHHRQLTAIDVTRSVAQVFKSSLFYCANEIDGCPENNGNIVRQKSHDGAMERTQDFSYDALNRLKTAGEVGGYSQTFDYDRYGNRWISAGTQVYGASVQPIVAGDYQASTNRFTKAANTIKYDLAGNAWNENGAIAKYDGEGRMVESTFPWGTGPVTRNYLALLGSAQIVAQRRLGDPSLPAELGPRSRPGVVAGHYLRHFRRRQPSCSVCHPSSLALGVASRQGGMA